MDNVARSRSFLRHTLPILVACGAFAALLLFVIRYGITLPYWDQWELVPTLVKMREGALTWQDLTAQHNAHRIFFPRLIMLGFAAMLDWNIAWELAVNVALGVCIFALLAAYGVETARAMQSLPSPWAVAVAALCAFSLAQWRNWLWGWQLQIFLCVACALAALMLLRHVERYRTALFAAIGVAAVATFSFAAGLAVWPAGLALLVWSKPRNVLFSAAVWTLVAVVMGALYLYGFEMPGDAQPPGMTLSGIWSVLAYALAFLGGAAANAVPTLSVAAGLVACSILACHGFEAWKSIGDRRQFSVIKGVGVFVVGAAVIAAMGRGGEGIAQAAAPRYTTFSAPFWFCAVMAAFAMAERRQGLVRRLWRIAAICMILALSGNSLLGAWAGAQRGNAMNAARGALVAGGSPELLGRLYPDVASLQERRLDLQRLGLSVFSDSK